MFQGKKYPVGKWPFVESLFNHYWLIYVSDFSISDGLSSTKASSTGIWPLITNRLGEGFDLGFSTMCEWLLEGGDFVSTVRVLLHKSFLWLLASCRCPSATDVDFHLIPSVQALYWLFIHRHVPKTLPMNVQSYDRWSIRDLEDLNTHQFRLAFYPPWCIFLRSNKIFAYFL